MKDLDGTSLKICLKIIKKTYTFYRGIVVIVTKYTFYVERPAYQRIIVTEEFTYAENNT